MHPLWQIKQIVNINGQFCVDRCNNFGGRGSQKIWWSFISLVLWVQSSNEVCMLSSVMLMIIFLVCITGDLEFYPEYEAFHAF